MNGTGPFQDRFNRAISYLRISVTDRCNLRCTYCMPEGDSHHCNREELLTFSEIESVARVFAERGLECIRLTGGEPLVRRALPDLIARLRHIPGINRIAMTSNGLLLSRFAQDLVDAGLDSLNVSLDTLRADRFRKITRRTGLTQVIEGIQAMQRIGATDIKLNVVVQRGVNEDEIEDLVRFSAEHNVVPRFIEWMPIGAGVPWKSAEYFGAREIRNALSRQWTIERTTGGTGYGPARYWRVHGPNLPVRGQRVGIISAVTEHFCGDCNRVRLTAQGGLRACLAEDTEGDLKSALRSAKNDQEMQHALTAAIEASLFGKRERHFFSLEESQHTQQRMHVLGG